MNEKKSGSMIGDALVLFAITLIAGLVLGTVYQVTKEPIAAQRKKRNRKRAWKCSRMRIPSKK